MDRTSSRKPSKTDWRILGELELRIDENADGVIRAWITEILDPLNVHSNFKSSILKSAQEAVARPQQNAGVGLKSEHVHFLVFAPADRSSERQSWGFFRIEKLESTAPSKSSREHAIEFYLYREG